MSQLPVSQTRRMTNLWGVLHTASAACGVSLLLASDLLPAAYAARLQMAVV